MTSLVLAMVTASGWRIVGLLGMVDLGLLHGDDILVGSVDSVHDFLIGLLP